MDLEVTQSDTGLSDESSHTPKAWIVTPTRVFDIDLIALSNDILHGWFVFATQPGARYLTAGGFIVLQPIVCITTVVLLFFDQIFQLVVLEYFHHLWPKNPESYLESSNYNQTVRVAGWILLSLCVTVMVILSAQITSTMLGIFWVKCNDIAPGAPLFLLKGALLLLCSLAYHLLAEYFPHLMLPPLGADISNTRTQTCWLGVIIFGVMVCVVVWRLRVYRRAKERINATAGYLLVLLIVSVAVMYILFAYLTYLYLTNYYHRYGYRGIFAAIRNPTSEAMKRAVQIFMLFFGTGLFPLISMILNRDWKAHIHHEDMAALDEILEAAGFSEEERWKEMSRCATVQENGRVVGISLYECKDLKTLPAAIKELSELTALNLEYCEKLEALPPEVGEMSKLTRVRLRGCDRLRVPPVDFRSSDNALSFMRELHDFRKQPINALKSSKRKQEVLFAAILDSRYAPALKEAVRADNGLASLRNKDNHTALELADRKCQAMMQAALVFYGRYDLDNKPKYESNTCQVFYANDYGQVEGEQKPVVLKFMHREEDLDAELNARKLHFNEKYVISALCHYNSNDDENFNVETDRFTPPLPKYCIVLKPGERNLHEVIHGNLIGAVNRGRAILQQLALSLNHLHRDRGLIHGDVKPKNIVWESESQTFQLIDFDAAVKETERMGSKVSSAFVPPEMVLQRDGQRPVLKALQVLERQNASPGRDPLSAGFRNLEGSDAVTRDDVLKAHSSFDVWSFGVVMYIVVAGQTSLIDGVDLRDNLNEEGLKQLARWNTEILEEKLGIVSDPSAKKLLRDLLHPVPEERPSMIDVLSKYEFFRTDKLAKEKERLAGVAAKKTKKIGKLEKELSAMRRSMGKRTELTEQLEELKRENVEINRKLDDLKVALTDKQANLLRGMLSIASITVPPLWVLMKVEESGKRARFRKSWTLHDKYHLFMLCQITGKCMHDPIELSFLKEEAREKLKKAAPLIQTTLLLLKVGLFVGSTVGRVYGIPLPSDLPFLGEDIASLMDGKHVKVRNPEMLQNNLNDMIGQLETLEDAATTRISGQSVDAWLGILSEWKERNESSGLETCAELRNLLNAGSKDGPYDDLKIAEISGLQKMVHEDGSCIWASGGDTKKKAKKQGYIPAGSRSKST